MIPFRNRFHGHNSLRFVYKNGKVVRSRFATLKSTPNVNRIHPRVVVVVSKKVLKSAVYRNRIRRRVYEHVRQQMHRFDKNYDLAIIITTSEVMTMPAADLAVQLEQLFDQSDLYKSL
jgi:ribonuclease P protein component